MELRVLTPAQRAINTWLEDFDFITCAVCKNTSAFVFEVDIEREGSVVDGKIVIDYDASATDHVVYRESRHIKRDVSFYPKPVRVAGALVRCVRCGHPVWHQQDIVAYHRQAECSGCELCMLEDRDSLIDHCRFCKERDPYPDCNKCIHGASREYHGLDY